MNPTAILSIANDAGVAEHPKMERQPRLRGVEGIRELADAALALPKELDDLEPGLVGECVKELDCTLGSGICGNGHEK